MSPPTVSTIVGRLVMPPGTRMGSHTTLRVVARTAAGEEHLPVAMQRDGSFALSAAGREPVAIDVLGPANEVLATRRLEGDSDDVVLTVGEGLDGEASALVGPTFVDSVALTSIRLRVERAVAAGELPPTAQGRLDRLEATLGLLDDLLPDAHRALAGDNEAAHRFRRGLLAVPTLGKSPSAAPPVATNRGSGRRWATFLLAGAASWIVTDEDDLVDLQTALAGALDAVLQFDLLLSVPAPEIGTLRSLMFAMGGFDANGGFAPDTQEFPSLPGLPGHPKPGGVILVPGGPLIIDLLDRRRRFHWDRELRLFIWDVPLYVESCIERAIREMSRLRSDAPQWLLQSIDQAAACPGEVIVLSGSGFGSTGVVYFNATGSGAEVAGSTISWSDTSISVRVPATAHPGPIRLSVPMGSVSFCGAIFPLTRLGKSEVEFVGGIPEIHYLTSSWRNGPLILPDADAVIDFGYSAASTVLADVSVWNGPTKLADFLGLSGGMHELTFHTPPSIVPLALRVDATARTACSTAKRSIVLAVGVPPKLTIVGMEVIQAVQRPDPLATGTGLGTSLRLAERKRTAVRAYVTSGLPATFSYGAAPSQVAITGTAKIGFGTVVPTAVFIARTTAQRLTALEFELPWPLCTGTKAITIDLRPAAADPAIGDALRSYVASRTMTATFDPQVDLALVRMRVRDGHYGLPAPTPAQWLSSVQGARERFPIAEDAIIIQIAPGWEEFATDHDLNTKDGWHDLLDDIDDIADDFADTGQVWTATAPTSAAYKLNGTAHAPFDWIWPIDNDYRALVVQATLAASCAHEMCHTFGIGHSPGGAVEDPDTSLPATLEANVIGWRATDGRTFAPGWADLMSYSEPKQDRWPSAELWNRLFDRLNS